MNAWRLACAIAVLLGCRCSLLTAGDNEGTVARSSVSLEFPLVTPEGTKIDLGPESGAKFTVICFLGTECPLARLYAPRLMELHDQFASKGVRFIGINSNSQDSPEDVEGYVREYHVSFPVVKDPGQKAADQFGAKRTPEIFVVDARFNVVYHGRIDDQFEPGVARDKPLRQDLREALEELAAGQPVSVPATEISGCLIGRKRTAATTANGNVTFCNQVSRVLNQHCVECHRPGEIGPFALTDYEEVAGWGETLLESIDAGRMPPWHANSAHGSFANARNMPDSDKQVLRDWVNSGMPYGDAAELPPPQEYASGWQLGREPDAVLKMRERPFHVPASGTVEYQYFVVDPHFEEDRWISAAQVIPGNRGIVHHVIVFVRPPDGTDARGVGYLTAYVPGQRCVPLPPGHARRVPAGSKFVFQMHYTPNGAEQDDLTQVGMLFIPESEVTHEAFTIVGIDQEFEIPPQTSDYPVHGDVGWFPKRAELLSLIPHMHVRGKAFQVTSTQAGNTEIILDVPRYDFNWQHVYQLSKPMPLAKIDKLQFTARFDNSTRNPANPDPSQTVTWGDQTWEEMAIAFLEVTEPRSGEQEAEPQRNKQKLIVKTAEEKSETKATDEFVKQFFARFDKNRDGLVERQETPLGFRRFGFFDFDANDDGKLDREEVQAAAEARQRKD